MHRKEHEIYAKQETEPVCFPWCSCQNLTSVFEASATVFTASFLLMNSFFDRIDHIRSVVDMICRIECCSAKDPPSNINRAYLFLVQMCMSLHWRRRKILNWFSKEFVINDYGFTRWWSPRRRRFVLNDGNEHLFSFNFHSWLLQHRWKRLLSPKVLNEYQTGKNL